MTQEKELEFTRADKDVARVTAARSEEIRNWMANGTIALSPYVERCLQAVEGDNEVVPIPNIQAWREWVMFVHVLHGVARQEATGKTSNSLWSFSAPEGSWAELAYAQDWGEFMKLLIGELRRVVERSRRLSAELAVSFSPGQAQLIAVIGDDSGEVYDLVADKPMTIGRSRDCDIVMSSEVVSRVHAVVTLLDNTLKVSDALSTNGVRASRGRTGEFVLSHTETFDLGPSVRLAFSDGSTPVLEFLLRALADEEPLV